MQNKSVLEINIYKLYTNTHAQQIESLTICPNNTNLHTSYCILICLNVRATQIHICTIIYKCVQMFALNRKLFYIETINTAKHPGKKQNKNKKSIVLRKQERIT